MKIEALEAAPAVSDDCKEENSKSEDLSWRRSKFQGYKESLFSFTIKRRTRSSFDDLDEVYDCRYKFNVHREKDVIEDPSYLTTTPSDVVSGEQGILLIVILQWDELFDNEISSSTTRDRTFFVSLTNMEDAVGDVISPIIHRLGITSPADNKRVTSRVVSSVTGLYYDSKEKHEEDWLPVVVDIVPERVSTKIDEWANKESHRFFVGSELAKYKNKRKRAIPTDDDDDDNSGDGEEEEDVYCSICFQPDDDEDDDELVAMPCCRHVYHEECLFQEVPRIEDCPVCLAPLLPAAAAAKNSKWRLQGSSKLRRLY